jgi:phage gp46-like protein
MNLQDFEGDILLTETPDGGDFIMNDGLIMADHNYSTAIYLSLFGGNKEDSGVVKTNKTWWGNTLRDTQKNEKLISRFQYVIRSMPLTVKNIKAAEDAAVLDLAWMVEEGIADKVEATGSTEGKNRFRIAINITKSGINIFNDSFNVLWGPNNGGI